MTTEVIVDISTTVHIIMEKKFVTNSSWMENVMLVKFVNSDTLRIVGTRCKTTKDADMKNLVDVCIDRVKENKKM